jgi:rod shape-determining protein MreD
VIVPLLLALSVMAVFLQVGLPLPWSPFDVPLLLTAFVGLTRGNGWGFACGALCGLGLDVLLSPHLGLRLLPLAMAGALADTLHPGVNREQHRLQVVAVMLLGVVHDAALLAVARAFGLHQGAWSRFLLAYALPRLAGQALACIPFFAILGLLVRRKVFLDPRQRDVQIIRRWP